ncbi:MAG: DNA internalization-related competence protein ComEC/Rec2 [Candidatus Thiodiazotropha sp. (ex. Lucinisca nassula)]|nr:DNA internalization-related competence protein ComEC/Rec2 [Candidatus Thiodiazotropha sp. (ex. Lucinisca nassula)]
MNRFLIGFIIGVALFHLLDHLPGLAWLSLLLTVPLLWRFKPLRPLVAMATGVGWSLLNASLILHQQLPVKLERSDLLLEGVVDSLPVTQGRLSRFQMRVTALQDENGKPVELSRVQLSWFGAEKEPSIGDAWRLKVRLIRPRGAQNPAGFDHEKWLFMQRVQAKGYVRDWPGNRQLESEQFPALLGLLRQKIARAIDEVSDKPEAAALLKALAVGDKRGMDRRAWETFTRTGTNHLIAISGLHIGLVAGWCLFTGSWLWRRSSRLCQRMPALKAGALFALLGAAVYAALAGFTLPTQRALIMLVATLGALILGYRIQFGRSLLLALFLVVLVDPLAILSRGFWLSFTAVAVILWSIGGRLAAWQDWRQGIQVQLSVSLGLLPLLILFFSQISLISPLVNLLMVPWFSLVLVPMTLIGLPLLVVPSIADFWFTLLQTLADATLQLLEWCSLQPFAMTDLAQQDPLLLWFVLAGCLILLLPAGMPGRGLGLLLCVPILFASVERPAHGEIWFTLLDVGQGLACVVETSNHLLLYDTGPGQGDRTAADSVIMPFLRSRGHRKIDTLIVSNGDRDHAGGVESLTQSIPIGQLLAGDPEMIEGAAQACLSGSEWQWDGVHFQILHPPASVEYQEPNNRSCVLKIESDDWMILLPGDIEQAAEDALLSVNPQQLRSDLVVAPHHGSNSSSTAEFVTAVDPQWVLFSTGYKNSYGFPKPEVIRRWQAQGAKLLNTAQSGAIEFRLTSGEVKVQPRLYRELNQRFWQLGDGVSGNHLRPE